VAAAFGTRFDTAEADVRSAVQSVFLVAVSDNQHVEQNNTNSSYVFVVRPDLLVYLLVAATTTTTTTIVR
jgi:hypothetical protein